MSARSVGKNMIFRRRCGLDSTMVEVKKVSRNHKGNNHVGPTSQNSSLLLSSAHKYPSDSISCLFFLYIPHLHFAAVCTHHI